VASLLGMSHTTGYQIGLKRRLDLEREKEGDQDVFLRKVNVR
jgi:hypothetical protein